MDHKGELFSTSLGDTRSSMKNPEENKLNEKTLTCKNNKTI